MEITTDMKRLLDIGIALTTEKDYNRLLEMILKESMDITLCDAGTLYILDQKGLKFKIMRNRTMDTYQGGDGKEIDLPPVQMTEENICTYAAIHHKMINIADVYHNEQFDFKGPKNYDKITGYHTESMLVFPLIDHENRLHGVIQLINAMKEDKIIAFEPKYEQIVYSLACQAAVTLANVRHLEEMKDMFHSMAAAFTTAIDERTPYNANHTKNVTRYVREFMQYVNSVQDKKQQMHSFTDNELVQIPLAAMLHDVGKMAVPLSVMNKDTRLGKLLENIHDRLEKILLCLEIDYLKGLLNEDVYNWKVAELEEVEEFIKNVNTMPFLEDQVIDRIKEIRHMQYRNKEGIMIPYLTEEEQECLNIRKGTLTEKERSIMESHVVSTKKILNEIQFGESYGQVVEMASQHHEYLNGSGYPNQLKATSLSIGTRLLTIMDIFDSLISADRPYKKPMPVARAVHILEEMADNGKLDSRLVNYWKLCLLSKGVLYDET